MPSKTLTGDWLLHINETRVVNREGRDVKAGLGKPPISLEDKELVARSRNGDQRALEELVRRHQEKAYAIALNMCSGNSEEALEHTQEAFMRAFRSLKSFRGKSSFFTWFYRILVNTCLDGRRRRRRWERIFSFWRRQQDEKAPIKDVLEEYPDPKENSNPLAVLSGKQLSQEIRKALQALPERQRLVFQLKVLHGMRIREIAQVIGVAEGTVKNHLFRATHFLRDALQEWSQP